MSNSHSSKPRADVLVSGGGSLYVFRALTDAAKEWIESNVSSEGFQPQFPEVLYVEHRYAHDLAAGMRDAGMVLA